MYFEPNPVDSKAEKQAFLSNKIKDNGEFEGSDPTGRNNLSIFTKIRNGDIRLLLMILKSWLVNHG
jgi:hypothetical protein